MDRKDHSRAALVFGGSRGIGAAIAQRLAADGFQVALTYVSRPDRAADVVANIQATGGLRSQSGRTVPIRSTSAPLSR